MHFGAGLRANLALHYHFSTHMHMSRVFKVPSLAVIVAASLFISNGVVHARSVEQSCEVDRASLLKLDQWYFDQDPTGGWQTLAARPGCEVAAADLVRDYRQANGLEASILYWHEGQLRARAGQTEQAVALMTQSRHRAGDPTGWNEYVDATIAFLLKKRTAFDDAWSRLAAVHSTPDVKNGYLEAHMSDGSVRKVRWPINIDVVEGLAECFDKSYREAYDTACRAPAK